MSRKGENIYKRKDGRWEGRYIKEYDANHKAKYGYIYARTYADAKCKLAEARAIPMTQRQIPRDSKELEYFCIFWLKEIKMKLKQSTYVKYYNIINNHILPSLGKQLISSINFVVIRKFIDDKLSHGRINGDGGLSVKSVKDIVSVLKLVLQYASAMGTECFCNFDAIKIKSQNKNVSALTKNEQSRLTTYLMSDTDNIKLGILICLYCGLRIGEICALKFEDIYDGVIHIKRTMQRVQTFSENKKTEVIITPPKSSYSVRQIPLPDFLNKLIEEFFIPKAYVLTGQTDHYTEPRTLQNKFKMHTEACGIYGVNFHITRHTFATRCVELGFEIKSLSEILGHSSVNITLNRYVHSSMELKKKNIDLLQREFIYSPS